MKANKNTPVVLSLTIEQLEVIEEALHVRAAQHYCDPASTVQAGDRFQNLANDIATHNPNR